MRLPAIRQESQPGQPQERQPTERDGQRGQQPGEPVGRANLCRIHAEAALAVLETLLDPTSAPIPGDHPARIPQAGGEIPWLLGLLSLRVGVCLTSTRMALADIPCCLMIYQCSSCQAESSTLTRWRGNTFGGRISRIPVPFPCWLIARKSCQNRSNCRSSACRFAIRQQQATFIQRSRGLP